MRNRNDDPFSFFNCTAVRLTYRSRKNHLDIKLTIRRSDSSEQRDRELPPQQISQALYSGPNGAVM